MKQYNKPMVELFLNETKEDIITTSDMPEFLRLISAGGGNTWDVSSAPRE